jgi:hypothetical protein
MVSMFLYVYVLRIIPTPAPRKLNPMFLLGMSICGLTILAVAIVFRRVKIQPVFEALRINPDDARSLQNWRSASIVSAVLAESVALLGFSIYMTGGTIAQSAGFFIAGIAAMLLWWPRRP